ncbi:MAG: glycosyltransferase family 4 protein [Rhodospirillales bacterium]|nr:glycosyltransferase family 4 protein [Rhodospirillales bacterium]MBN8907369.1 glycosyltransferase family 4 protein [Rhodospirillales bacterium]
MKILFVHQNFPGQFLHIVRHLVQMKHHEIAFITEPNVNVIAGVHKVPYAKPAAGHAEVHLAARELDGAVRRADAVARTATNLKRLGFDADIVIGHHGWGELLNLPEVWPNAPVLGYLEFYYNTHGVDVGFDPEFPNDPADYPRIRAKNAINHIALNLGAHGQSPTEWQRSTYPAWARDQINLVWEGVNLDVCAPDESLRRAAFKIGDMTIRAGDKLVTYVSRDLEPYRGFHAMMRALPHLLKARKDIKVVMVGGDGISYGALPTDAPNWREKMLRELGSSIDPKRVVFPGRVDYQTYLKLLKRSDAHVYLTYPFVASWSLRESLAAGCAVVGSDTQPVQEFITHEENGLLAPFFDSKGIANSVLRVLEDKALSDRLRHAARAYAEARLSMQDYLKSYEALIERLTGKPIGEPESKPAPRRRATSAAAPQPAAGAVRARRTARQPG